jgi:hypothetical protein
MRDRDPLEQWSWFSAIADEDHRIPDQQQKEVTQGLDRLAEFLEDPPPKPNLTNLTIPNWAWAKLSSSDLARAQNLYKGVFAVGGAGNQYVQESLLTLISNTADASSIPFWIELLDLTRPRDLFTNKRKTLAIASLARLAIHRNTPEAYDALRKITRHSNADARALAVHYLGRAYLDAKRPLPSEVADELFEIAIHDPASTVRFQARDALRRKELPVPMDNPDSVYAFKVKLRYDKEFRCVIEMASGETLEGLHLAIQGAYRWDNDHLYSFFLNGELYDERYAFACPFEQDAPRRTDEWKIGELGLALKHKFLYFFDYGDSHEFDVEVAEIKPRDNRAKYPRLVERKGKPPKQYWSDLDDEDGEDEADG